MAENTKTVRMAARISGTRDGENWPNPGETIELPEGEANTLLISGAAVLPEDVATATLAGGIETATTPGIQSARGNAPLRQTATQAKADADAQALARAQAADTAGDLAREQLEAQAKESADAAAKEAKATEAAAKKAAAKS